MVFLIKLYRETARIGKVVQASHSVRAKRVEFDPVRFGCMNKENGHHVICRLSSCSIIIFFVSPFVLILT